MALARGRALKTRSVPPASFEKVEAILRNPALYELAKVIPQGIARVEGVERTETLIAFQVYSKHDLDRLFSIGFEEREG